MVVILYYNYRPSDARKRTKDVIVYTAGIMNNEEISALPDDIEFVMTGKEPDVDVPVETDIVQGLSAHILKR